MLTRGIKLNKILDATHGYNSYSYYAIKLPIVLNDTNLSSNEIKIQSVNEVSLNNIQVIENTVNFKNIQTGSSVISNLTSNEYMKIIRDDKFYYMVGYGKYESGGVVQDVGAFVRYFQVNPATLNPDATIRLYLKSANRSVLENLDKIPLTMIGFNVNNEGPDILDPCELIVTYTEYVSGVGVGIV
jgi:hypothetical protein